MKKTTYIIIGLLGLVFLVETAFIFLILSREPNYPKMEAVEESKVITDTIMDPDIVKYDKVEVRKYDETFVVYLPDDAEYSVDTDVDGYITVDTLVIITTGNKIILR